MGENIISLKVRRMVYHMFCYFNFMVFLTVITAPFWLWNNFNDDFIFMGLWLKCDNSGCHRATLPNVSPNILQSAQWLALFALITSLISLILSLENLTQSRQMALCRKLISTMTHFSAGVFLLLSLMIVCLGITHKMNIEEIHLSPSFNFYIGCFASALDFLLGIVCFMHPVDLFESSKKRKAPRLVFTTV